MNTLYKKIKNRLTKYYKDIVPWNTHLRPHSFCEIGTVSRNSHDSQEITLHPILPNLVTNLNITEELFEACSSYWKPQRQVVTDYVVTQIPHGRICTDNEKSVAIITNRNRLVDNVSLSLQGGKATGAGFNSIFEQRYFTKPVKIKGAVFSMLSGGAGLNNISHWFLDVLPRLYLLRESGLYDKVDWFLVPSLQYDYQRESLNLLGIPESKLMAGDKYPHITADNVIASTAPRGNHTLVPTWACDYIRDSFMPLAENVQTDKKMNSKIYINRRDSGIRKVINETELEEALLLKGFESITLSEYSIMEKIKLFSQAETIIGATGAGLVSLLFCKPGTKVIELFSEGFVIEPFYDIATKLDLDYEYIICKSSKKVYNAHQGQRADLKVDLELLNGKLEKSKTPVKLREVA